MNNKLNKNNNRKYYKTQPTHPTPPPILPLQKKRMSTLLLLLLRPIVYMRVRACVRSVDNAATNKTRIGVEPQNTNKINIH